jgi:D-alanyl-lipoteichoic acid acyltransferase DltB (MBOAT superfamily)
VTRVGFHSGLLLIFQGLFKKIVLADLLAGLGVDAVFNNPAEFSSLDLMLALYGYAFQIYNDFSGYTDVAIGAARMLGYEILPNFNRPYLSANMREFWTRWHISLSSWLRDYLYIELGGNRKGEARKLANLMLTMLLGGLWHGAGLNFIAWGAYHGALLVGSHLRLPASREGHGATPHFAVLLRKRIITFHLVLVGWLLFRVHDMGHFVEFVKGLARFTMGTRMQPLYFAILLIAMVLHFVPKDATSRVLERVPKLPVPVQAAGYAGCILVFWALSLGAPAFIYFQF